MRIRTPGSGRLRRAVAAAAVVPVAVLGAAGCGGDEQENELVDVENTEVPVDPPVDVEEP